MTGYKSKRAMAQDKLDSMEREALKLALEALRMADELCRGHGVDFKEYGLKFDRDIQVKYKEAITAIKEALAQPEREPVEDVVEYFADGTRIVRIAPQRPWVDLTRTQIQNVYFVVLEEHRGVPQMQGQLAFGEALQAAIKDKNK
jgi:uncharacterized alkaline shock family protein YloU